MIETTQWRVTWFPPDKMEATLSGTEAKVRMVAAREAEWNPIIESRTVAVGEWKMEMS